MNTLLRHLLTTPILVCGLGLLSLLKSPAASSGTVAIGSAANFSKPLQEIARRFEAQSGHTTRISHGSSGKLYAQIRQGAPYDVFLSADSDKPQRLSEAGFGAPDGPFTYAIGQLYNTLKASLFDALSSRFGWGKCQPPYIFTPLSRVIKRLRLVQG